jgi:hypothetical protein
MGHRPTLNDLVKTLLYSVSHDEKTGATLRLLAMGVVLVVMGFIGGLIVQNIPSPSAKYYDATRKCVYDAASAEAPDNVPAQNDKQATQGHSVVAPPGLPVYAQWFIRNTGSCPWEAGVQFRLTGGNIPVMTTTLSAPDYSFPIPGQPMIMPQEIFAPVVEMTAPSQPGTYVTAWRLYSPNDRWFGPEFRFSIDVADVAGVAPAGPKFIVDWWFIIPALIGITLALVRAGQFVTQMYSLKSAGRGIKFIVDTTFGIPLGRASLTVHYGEYEHPNADEYDVLTKIGGPGVLTVLDDTAVLTERGARFSRLLGPEEHTLKPFERVRMIYDLRTQSLSGTETSLTKDGIPIRAGVSAMFCFMKRMPGEPSALPPHPRFLSMLRHYLRRTPMVASADVEEASKQDPAQDKKPPLPGVPVSAEALRLALYEVHVFPPNKIKWNNAANAAATGEVRDELARRTLDEIFAPDDAARSPRREIAEKLRASATNILAARGLTLVDVGFANLEVPRPVADLRREYWQVNWEKESALTRAAGETDALLQVQTARAEAQAELIKSIIQAARSMNQDNRLSLDVIEALARYIDRALQREAALPQPANSRREMDQVLERMRRLLLPPPAPKSGK